MKSRYVQGTAAVSGWQTLALIVGVTVLVLMVLVVGAWAVFFVLTTTWPSGFTTLPYMDNHPVHVWACIARYTGRSPRAIVPQRRLIRPRLLSRVWNASPCHGLNLRNTTSPSVSLGPQLAHGVTKLPNLVCLPTADSGFAAVVQLTMAEQPWIDTPRQLEDALRPYFSAISVHRRELDGEPRQTWYVYRDGGYLTRRDWRRD
jgi:hypothetical protein